MKPLDTDVVANLDVLDELTPRDHDARTFMSANEGHLGLERPVAIDGVQVSMTNTAILDVDEDFIRSWLGDGNLLVLDSCRVR